MNLRIFSSDFILNSIPLLPPSYRHHANCRPQRSGVTFGTMNCWKLILPVLALLASFGLAGAEEKKAQLAYYYLDG